MPQRIIAHSANRKASKICFVSSGSRGNESDDSSRFHSTMMSRVRKD